MNLFSIHPEAEVEHHLDISPYCIIRILFDVGTDISAVFRPSLQRYFPAKEVQNSPIGL